MEKARETSTLVDDHCSRLSRTGAKDNRGVALNDTKQGKKTEKVCTQTPTEYFESAPKDLTKVKMLMITAQKSSNSGERVEAQKLLSSTGRGDGHTHSACDQYHVNSVQHPSEERTASTEEQVATKSHTYTCTPSINFSTTNQDTSTCTSAIRSSTTNSDNFSDAIDIHVKKKACHDLFGKKLAHRITRNTQTLKETQYGCPSGTCESGNVESSRKAKLCSNSAVTVINQEGCLVHKLETSSVSSGKQNNESGMHLNSIQSSGRTQESYISTGNDTCTCLIAKSDASSKVTVHANVDAAVGVLQPVHKGNISLVCLKYLKNRDIMSIQARIKKKGAQNMDRQRSQSPVTKARSESPRVDTSRRSSPRLQRKEFCSADKQNENVEWQKEAGVEENRDIESIAFSSPKGRCSPRSHERQTLQGVSSVHESKGSLKGKPEELPDTSNTSDLEIVTCSIHTHGRSKCYEVAEGQERKASKPASKGMEKAGIAKNKDLGGNILVTLKESESDSEIALREKKCTLVSPQPHKSETGKLIQQNSGRKHQSNETCKNASSGSTQSRQVKIEDVRRTVVNKTDPLLRDKDHERKFRESRPDLIRQNEDRDEETWTYEGNTSKGVGLNDSQESCLSIFSKFHTENVSVEKSPRTRKTGHEKQSRDRSPRTQNKVQEDHLSVVGQVSREECNAKIPDSTYPSLLRRKSPKIKGTDERMDKKENSLTRKDLDTLPRHSCEERGKTIKITNTEEKIDASRVTSPKMRNKDQEGSRKESNPAPRRKGSEKNKVGTSLEGNSGDQKRSKILKDSDLTEDLTNLVDCTVRSPGYVRSKDHEKEKSQRVKRKGFECNSGNGTGEKRNHERSGTVMDPNFKEKHTCSKESSVSIRNKGKRTKTSRESSPRTKRKDYERIRMVGSANEKRLATGVTSEAVCHTVNIQDKEKNSSGDSTFIVNSDRWTCGEQSSHKRLDVNSKNQHIMEELHENSPEQSLGKQFGVKGKTDVDIGVQANVGDSQTVFWQKKLLTLSNSETVCLKKSQVRTNCLKFETEVKSDVGVAEEKHQTVRHDPSDKWAGKLQTVRQDPSDKWDTLQTNISPQKLNKGVGNIRKSPSRQTKASDVVSTSCIKSAHDTGRQNVVSHIEVCGLADSGVVLSSYDSVPAKEESKNSFRVNFEKLNAPTDMQVNSENPNVHVHGTGLKANNASTRLLTMQRSMSVKTEVSGRSATSSESDFNNHRKSIAKPGEIMPDNNRGTRPLHLTDEQEKPAMYDSLEHNGSLVMRMPMSHLTDSSSVITDNKSANQSCSVQSKSPKKRGRPRKSLLYPSSGKSSSSSPSTSPVETGGVASADKISPTVGKAGTHTRSGRLIKRTAISLESGISIEGKVRVVNEADVGSVKKSPKETSPTNSVQIAAFHQNKTSNACRQLNFPVEDRKECEIRTGENLKNPALAMLISQITHRLQAGKGQEIDLLQYDQELSDSESDSDHDGKDSPSLGTSPSDSNSTRSSGGGSVSSAQNCNTKDSQRRSHDGSQVMQGEEVPMELSSSQTRDMIETEEETTDEPDKMTTQEQDNSDNNNNSDKHTETDPEESPKSGNGREVVIDITDSPEGTEWCDMGGAGYVKSTSLNARRSLDMTLLKSINVSTSPSQVFMDACGNINDHRTSEGNDRGHADAATSQNDVANPVTVMDGNNIDSMTRSSPYADKTITNEKEKPSQPERNPHSCFEKLAPPEKQKTSAFFSDELEKYLERHGELKRANISENLTSKKQPPPKFSTPAVSGPDAEPDVDEIDGVLFLSFTSERALKAHLNSQQGHEASESYNTVLSHFLSLRKAQEHGTKVNHKRQQELNARLQTFSRALLAGQGCYSALTKTKDVTKLKGWKRKLLQATCTGDEDLASTIELLKSGKKLHWKTQEKLFKSKAVDEIRQMGLELKKKRRKLPAYTRRKGSNKPTNVAVAGFTRTLDGKIIRRRSDERCTTSGTGQEAASPRDSQPEGRLLPQLLLRQSSFYTTQLCQGKGLRPKSPRSIKRFREMLQRKGLVHDTSSEDIRKPRPKFARFQIRNNQMVQHLPQPVVRMKNTMRLTVLSKQLVMAALSALKAPAPATPPLPLLDSQSLSPVSKRKEDHNPNASPRTSPPQGNCDKAGCRYGCICHLCAPLPAGKETSTTKTTDQKEGCSKEYCRLGCICDSLSLTSRPGGPRRTKRKRSTSLDSQDTDMLLREEKRKRKKRKKKNKKNKTKSSLIFFEASSLFDEVAQQPKRKKAKSVPANKQTGSKASGSGKNVADSDSSCPGDMVCSQQTKDTCASVETVRGRQNNKESVVHTLHTEKVKVEKDADCQLILDAALQDSETFSCARTSAYVPRRRKLLCACGEDWKMGHSCRLSRESTPLPWARSSGGSTPLPWNRHSRESTPVPWNKKNTSGESTSQVVPSGEESACVVERMDTNISKGMQECEQGKTGKKQRTENKDVAASAVGVASQKFKIQMVLLQRKIKTVQGRNMRDNETSFNEGKQARQGEQSQSITKGPIVGQVGASSDQSSQASVDNDQPHLLEITSNCDWESVRSQLLSQISTIADTCSWPVPQVIIIEDFTVEILPKSKKPTAIPVHLRPKLPNQMYAIRVKIVKTATRELDVKRSEVAHLPVVSTAAETGVSERPVMASKPEAPGRLQTMAPRRYVKCKDTEVIPPVAQMTEVKDSLSQYAGISGLNRLRLSIPGLQPLEGQQAYTSAMGPQRSDNSHTPSQTQGATNDLATFTQQTSGDVASKITTKAVPVSQSAEQVPTTVTQKPAKKSTAKRNKPVRPPDVTSECLATAAQQIPGGMVSKSAASTAKAAPVPQTGSSDLSGPTEQTLSDTASKTKHVPQLKLQEKTPAPATLSSCKPFVSLSSAVSHISRNTSQAVLPPGVALIPVSMVTSFPPSGNQTPPVNVVTGYRPTGNKAVPVSVVNSGPLTRNKAVPVSMVASLPPTRNTTVPVTVMTDTVLFGNSTLPVTMPPSTETRTVSSKVAPSTPGSVLGAETTLSDGPAPTVATSTTFYSVSKPIFTRAKLPAGKNSQVVSGLGVRPQLMSGPGVSPQLMSGPGVRPQLMSGPGVHPQLMGGPGVRPQLMSGPGVRPQVLFAQGPHGTQQLFIPVQQLQSVCLPGSAAVQTSTSGKPVVPSISPSVVTSGGSALPLVQVVPVCIISTSVCGGHTLPAQAGNQGTMAPVAVKPLALLSQPIATATLQTANTALGAKPCALDTGQSGRAGKTKGSAVVGKDEKLVTSGTAVETKDVWSTASAAPGMVITDLSQVGDIKVSLTATDSASTKTADNKEKEFAVSDTAGSQAEDSSEHSPTLRKEQSIASPSSADKEMPTLGGQHTCLQTTGDSIPEQAATQLVENTMHQCMTESPNTCDKKLKPFCQELNGGGVAECREKEPVGHKGKLPQGETRTELRGDQNDKDLQCVESGSQSVLSPVFSEKGISEEEKSAEGESMTQRKHVTQKDFVVTPKTALTSTAKLHPLSMSVEGSPLTPLVLSTCSPKLRAKASPMLKTETCPSFTPSVAAKHNTVQAKITGGRLHVVQTESEPPGEKTGEDKPGGGVQQQLVQQQSDNSALHIHPRNKLKSSKEQRKKELCASSMNEFLASLEKAQLLAQTNHGKRDSVEPDGNLPVHSRKDDLNRSITSISSTSLSSSVAHSICDSDFEVDVEGLDDDQEDEDVDVMSCDSETALPAATMLRRNLGSHVPRVRSVVVKNKRKQAHSDSLMPQSLEFTEELLLVEGGRSSRGSPQRLIHQSRERQRRSDLGSKFQVLKDLCLPNLDRVSKHKLLMSARERIEEAIRQEKVLLLEKQREMRRRTNLMARLTQLKEFCKRKLESNVTVDEERKTKIIRREGVECIDLTDSPVKVAPDVSSAGTSQTSEAETCRKDSVDGTKAAANSSSYADPSHMDTIKIDDTDIQVMKVTLVNVKETNTLPSEYDWQLPHDVETSSQLDYIVDLLPEEDDN